MYKFFTTLSVTALMCSCSPVHETSNVYHFSDGRYGYEVDDTWYWLLILNSNNNTNYYTSSSIASTPSNVSWVKNGISPNPKEIEEAVEFSPDQSAKLETEINESEIINDGEAIVTHENEAASNENESVSDNNADSGDVGGDSSGGGDSGGGGGE